jgi:O-antigen ligase
VVAQGCAGLPEDSPAAAKLTLAVAVALLVLVLWATGSAVQSLWMTPVIIFVLWIAIQLWLGSRATLVP